MTYRDPVRTRLVSLALSTSLALSLAPAALAPAAMAAPDGTRTAPDPLNRFYTQTLDWESCAEGRCAWLTVPLDYDDPAGETIRLRVSRAAATGTADQRIGSLVVNPGGPGVPGLDYASYLSASLEKKVSRAYDMVGFDPRGVGQSAPISCLTGAQTTRWLRTDMTPDTAAERAVLMRRARALADGCLRRSPEIARHVGSEETVRDMDILREALGDDSLNLLGYSYGTYLGTRYAELFPDRVGRFVLDGAVDPSLDIMEVSKDQSDGFQLALTRFAKDCSGRPACPWKGSAKDVLAGLNTLLADLDTNPLPTHRGRRLVQSEAINAVFYAMYSPSLWPSLRTALRQAVAGDGLGLAEMAAYASDELAPNRYGSNMASAFPAIACWDAPAAPDSAGLQAAATRWAADAPVPLMARAMSWSNAPCSVWYGHSSVPPARADSATTSPILIIGGTYDPATPYAWAQALNRQLPTSTLLTYRGDGHTVYGGGSGCVNGIVDDYLVTGALPKVGTTCR